MDRHDAAHELEDVPVPPRRSGALDRARHRSWWRTGLIWAGFTTALILWDLKLDLWATWVVKSLGIVVQLMGALMGFFRSIAAIVLLAGCIWTVMFLIWACSWLRSIDLHGPRAIRAGATLALLLAMTVSVWAVRFAGVHPSTAVGYMVRDFEDHRGAFRALEQRYLQGDLAWVPPDQEWMSATFGDIGRAGPDLWTTPLSPSFLPGPHVGTMRVCFTSVWSRSRLSFDFDPEGQFGEDWIPVGWTPGRSVDLGDGWTACEYVKSP